MDIVNIETGEIAWTTRWDPKDSDRIMVISLDGGMRSSFADKWQCMCHGMKPSRDPYGKNIAMCKRRADEMFGDCYDTIKLDKNAK